MSRAPHRRPPTRKAPPSPLLPGHSVDEAIVLILGDCLDQVRANRPAAADGRGVEGVHQMRVGLRRLRAALKALSKAVPARSFRDFDRRAKALADSLGPARSLDVLEERLARPDGPLRPVRREVLALRVAARARRDAAYARLHPVLESPQTGAWLDALRRWIEKRGWREDIPDEALPYLASPAHRLAEDALDRLEKKARKRGAGFARLTPRGRHKFRIALKQLRYLGKFFAPLYGFEDKTAHGKKGRRTKRYLSRIAKLLDALGDDHDDVTLPATLKNVTSGTETPGAGRATRMVLSARKARRPALRKEMLKRRRKWKKTTRFW